MELDINDIFLYAKKLQKPSPQNVLAPQPASFISSLAQQFIPQAQPQQFANPQIPPFNNIPVHLRSPPVNSSNPGTNLQYK